MHRKAIHLFGLVIPLGYLLFPNPGQAKAILAGAMVYGVFIDIYRLNEPRLRGFVNSLIGAVMRPHEKTGLLGSTCILIASVMTVLIFPKPVAVAALVLLIAGDTAAALVGRRFGRVRIFGGKTLEGTLAFVVVGGALAEAVAAVAARMNPTEVLSPQAAAAGALVGAMVEAVPFPIDDNFAIPIISGVAMVLAGIR